MAYFDWRACVVEQNHERSDKDWDEKKPRGGRGAWKTTVVAGYLFEGDLDRKRNPERFLGILPTLWTILFGTSDKTTPDKRFNADDFDLGPDEAALIVREGRVLETFREQRVTRGGFLNWLKAMVGVHSRFRILMATLAPFPVEIEHTEGVLTADDVEVSGTVHLSVVPDPDHLAKLLRLMRGRNILLSTDVVQDIEPVLVAKVLVPQVRLLDSSTLRTDPVALQRIEQAIRQEVSPLLADTGLIIDKVTVVWQRTGTEKRAQEIKEARLDEDKKDFHAEQAIREVRRSAELQRVEHELRTLAGKKQTLEAQLIDAKGAVEKAKLEVELRRVQIETERLTKVAQLELRKLEQDQDFESAKRNEERALDYSRRRETQDLDVLERKRKIDREHEITLKEADTKSRLDLILAQASFTPEQILALQATGSPEAAKALGEKFKAEAARDQSAASKMLDIAQRAGEKLQDQAVKFGDQMAEVASAAASGARSAQCPSCSKAVQPTWRTCPFCMADLPFARGAKRVEG